jgi:phosphoribosylglycinamide formyltransferase-1
MLVRNANSSYYGIMNARYHPQVAVFASGGGTTFRAVADAIHQGLVDFEVQLVITDREDAGVLQQVAEVNRLYGFAIKTAIINRQRYPGGPQGRGQTRAEAEATCAALQANNIDHLSLMGCLRVIAAQVVEEYGWRPEYAVTEPKHQGMYRARMSNTHPGILPATADTYGIHTQEKVLDLGLRETAQTFHVVATGIDTGPVIAEHRVQAYPASLYPAAMADTPQKLFARVQRVEKTYLPLDLDGFLKDQARQNSS